MTEKIVFTPNVPVQVALKFADGKEVEGRFGNQMLFSLVDGRVMYANMDLAAKINLIEPRKAEPFMICQRWTGKKGDQRQWDVWRPDPDERQPVAKVTPEPPPEPPDRRAGASVTAPTPVRQIAEATQQHSNGNGLNGNGFNRVNPALPIPPTKIPMNEAVVEAVKMVQHAMKVTGEQWSDQSRQDMVSTILITAQREGWLARWTRGQE